MEKQKQILRNNLILLLITVLITTISCNQKKSENKKTKLNLNNNEALYLLEFVNAPNDLRKFLEEELHNKAFILDTSCNIKKIAKDENYQNLTKYKANKFLIINKIDKIEINDIFKKTNDVFKIKVIFYRPLIGRFKVDLRLLKKENDKWKHWCNPGNFRFPSDYEFQNGKQELDEKELKERILDLIINLSFK